MQFRLPIPQNWQDFESICHRLWIEIWNDANAKKNGRQGQAQNGVDIFGTPAFSRMFSGIQCKDKNEQLGSVLQVEELIRECKKATNFKPKLEVFTMATTSSRDAKLQEQVRVLKEQEHLPFAIDVWFWDDIESEVIYRPGILEHFYKGLPIEAGEQRIIKLNKTSPKDQCAAFFSRPMLNDMFNSQLKSYLISVAYELKDNSFRHGNATEFCILVNDNKVQFTDNGASYNILEKKDESKTSDAGYVGTFVVHEFLRKFQDYTQANFKSEEIDGNTKNIIEFEISKEAGEILKEDFIEVEIAAPGARADAAKLARALPITNQIKEVIWNMTSGAGYALSFSAEFVRILLLRLNVDQRLLLYVPRHGMFSEIQKLFNDERLKVITR